MSSPTLSLHKTIPSAGTCTWPRLLFELASSTFGCFERQRGCRLRRIPNALWRRGDEGQRPEPCASATFWMNTHHSATRLRLWAVHGKLGASGRVLAEKHSVRSRSLTR